MDYTEFFYKRISELRIQKGVSARDMSLSLGQSESYINKIENKHALPSMPGFFYICEYLHITPAEFFDADCLSPSHVDVLSKEFMKLTPLQAEHVLNIVRDLNSK